MSSDDSASGAVPHGPGYCNAYKRKTGSYCGQPEGAGTGYHIGPCRAHGGMLPRVRRRAAEETYHLIYAGKTMFGQKLPVDPQTGILDVLGYQAGNVEYLRRQISALADPDGNVPFDAIRDDYWEPWTKALKDLAATFKMAGDLRVADRLTNLIEARQDMVLGLLEGVLADAGHDPESPEVVSIITRRLELVAGNTEAGAA